MKTNSILTSIVVMKTGKRFERVNFFLKAGGCGIKTEAVSVTDFLCRVCFLTKDDTQCGSFV